MGSSLEADPTGGQAGPLGEERPIRHLWHELAWSPCGSGGNGRPTRAPGEARDAFGNLEAPEP